MTEPPVAPTLSKKKYFLVLAGIMVVFYTVAPYLLGGVLSVVYPTTDVNLELVLHDAEVTDVWHNRQLYLYYLDGATWQMHDFNSFVPADSAVRTGMDSDLGYDPSSLGHYLRRGDRLTKAANSPLLTVRRGPITTRWILYAFTPEAKLPPPVKIAILPGGDTVVIP
jgi:hypothetical protein